MVEEAEKSFLQGKVTLINNYVVLGSALSEYNDLEESYLFKGLLKKKGPKWYADMNKLLYTGAAQMGIQDGELTAVLHYEYGSIIDSYKPVIDNPKHDDIRTASCLAAKIKYSISTLKTIGHWSIDPFISKLIVLNEALLPALLGIANLELMERYGEELKVLEDKIFKK